MFDVLTKETTDKPATPRKTTVERERMASWLEERIASGRRKASAEVVTLTPALAELLLEHNTDNRPITSNNAGNIAADIANGRFEFNGESIVISRDGVLIDGQHRCAVVVQTRTPVETVIVFGPKTDARFTIDIGRPKSAGNFLHMQGYKNTNVLASAARLILIYRHHGKIVSSSRDYAHKPTKTEVVAAAGQLPGLALSVDFFAATPRSLGSRSVLAACHYLIAKKSSRENADHFFRRLIEGSDLKRGDPILYCRNKLPDHRAVAGSGINSMMELIFKCWNANRRGEEITRMFFNGRLPKIER